MNMGTNTYGYVFDSIGNRITATNNADLAVYTANELNQYTNILCTSAPLSEPSYDDDGNMLTNGVFSFAWDGENRLIGVLSNGVFLATHTYDHQSRRIRKVSCGGTITLRFVYDDLNLISETSIADFATISTHFIWGLDLSGNLQGAGGVGGLLAAVKNDTTYTPAFDASGNVLDYTDALGTVVAHYVFTPFGYTVVQSGDLSDVFAFRFSTKYRECEGELYYYGYRYFVPYVGRWLNRDRIAEYGGVNIYGFCRENPISYYDLNGESAVANAIIAFIAADTAVPEPSDLCWPKWVAYIFVGGVAYSWVSDVVEDDQCCRKVQEEEKPCRPCKPYPAGTLVYQGPDVGHTHHPAGDPHYHVKVVNQDPASCACFWNKAVPDAVDPPVAGPIFPHGVPLPMLSF